MTTAAVQQGELIIESRESLALYTNEIDTLKREVLQRLMDMNDL